MNSGVKQGQFRCSSCVGHVVYSYVCVWWWQWFISLWGIYKHVGRFMRVYNLLWLFFNTLYVLFPKTGFDKDKSICVTMTGYTVNCCLSFYFNSCSEKLWKGKSPNLRREDSCGSTFTIYSMTIYILQYLWVEPTVPKCWRVVLKERYNPFHWFFYIACNYSSVTLTGFTQVKGKLIR